MRWQVPGAHEHIWQLWDPGGIWWCLGSLEDGSRERNHWWCARCWSPWLPISGMHWWQSWRATQSIVGWVRDLGVVRQVVSKSWFDLSCVVLNFLSGTSHSPTVGINMNGLFLQEPPCLPQNNLKRLTKHNYNLCTPMQILTWRRVFRDKVLSTNWKRRLSSICWYNKGGAVMVSFIFWSL